jgi:hypothetical protein
VRPFDERHDDPGDRTWDDAYVRQVVPLDARGFLCVQPPWQYITKVSPCDVTPAGSSTPRRRVRADSTPRAMTHEELAEFGNVDVERQRRADGIRLPFIITGENPETRAFFAKFDKAHMPPGRVK